MLLHIFPYARQIYYHRHAHTFQNLPLSDTRELQDLRRAQRSRSEDHFLLRMHDARLTAVFKLDMCSSNILALGLAQRDPVHARLDEDEEIRPITVRKVVRL